MHKCGLFSVGVGASPIGCNELDPYSTFSCVLTPHLRTTTAFLHTTPLPTSIFTCIEKEPTTIADTRALLDPLPFVRGQNSDCRVRDRPQNAFKLYIMLDPLPCEVRCFLGKLSSMHCVREYTLKDLYVRLFWLSTRCKCRENGINRFIIVNRRRK